MTRIDGGLRALFRRKLPMFHWTSIETGGTGLGIADSNYLADGGIEGWIEFKQTGANRIQSFEPEQAAWLHRRSRLGGRVWLAVRFHHEGGPRLGDPVDDLFMIPGREALRVRAGGVLCTTDLPPGHMCVRMKGGPAKWDWEWVGRLLLRPGMPPVDGLDGPEAAVGVHREEPVDSGARAGRTPRRSRERR